MTINPFDILKNAQKIQEQMGSFQEKLGGITVTGSSGGGMVQIDLSGRLEVLRVSIEKEVVDPDDTQLLADLFQAALTNALDKVRETVQEEMKAATGMLNIPGLGNLGGMGGIPGFPGL